MNPMGAQNMAAMVAALKDKYVGAKKGSKKGARKSLPQLGK